MRTFIVACLFFNFAAFAQEDGKTYSEMTIEELQSIDSKALSRSDKKLHEKALKTAKKVEKKRIKSEIKAEKKRLKAERKKRKKHNKRVQSRIDLMETVRSKVWYEKNEFETHGQFFGPIYPARSEFLSIQGHRKPWDYQIRTTTQANGEFSLKVIISLNTTTIKDIYSGTGEPYYEHLMREANHYDYWQHYNRATLAGGIDLPLRNGRKYLDRCTLEHCSFREDVIWEISDEMLTYMLENMQPMRIRISSSRSGAYHIVNIDPAYLVGFLIGLAENSTDSESLMRIAKIAAKNLEAQLQ